MVENDSALPLGLASPLDDDIMSRLKGARLPDLALPSTDGGSVHLGSLAGRFVFYVYPMTASPGVPLPDNWDDIPGARGCTPQACSFRDHYAELLSLEAGVFGLSAQTTNYQKEARDRLRLPFQLLSDRSLQLKRLLGLPTFRAGELELYRRLTWIANHGRIEKVFYPVVRPDYNVIDVLDWLRSNS